MIDVQSSQPFFSNDLQGFLKFVGSSLIVLGPVYGLVIWWLRRGPDKDIADLRRDLEGLGKRTTDMEHEHERFGTTTSSHGERLAQSEQERKEFRERITRQEAAVEEMKRTMTEYQNELTNLIVTTSRQQMEATHKVEIEVAKLSERANLADSLSGLGKNIERAVRIAVRREDEAA